MSKNPADLTGKVVAITGGARGIGRATAEAFLRRGAQVAIGDLDHQLAKETVAELTMAGGEAIGLQLDVTSRQSFASFLDDVATENGGLDVLVNNAGIMPTGLFADEQDSMTDRMIDINLRGVLTGSKLAAERLSSGGHIVNIASLAGVSAYAGLATYSATKHAVLGFSDALRRELADQGIGVTVVLPGVVRTELSAGNTVPIWARPLAEVHPEQVAAAIVDAIGTGRSRVTVPPALGVMLKAMSLMPGSARQRVERLVHFDTAFSNVDTQVRAAYMDRISAETIES